MKFADGRFSSLLVDRGVAVTGEEPLSGVPGLLGMELVDRDLIGTDWARLHFRAEAASVTADADTPPFANDFCDSVVQCRSGDEAWAAFWPARPDAARRRLPAAHLFAFAQQWARLGCLCVHGALLRLHGTGVLLLGASGSGKSVAAASALRAGGELVTDDYLLLALPAGVPTGERLRNYLSLRQSALSARLLMDGSDRWNADGNRLFLPIATGDRRFPACARIDRIWVLSPPASAHPDRARLEPLSQAQVWAGLVGATQPLLLGPSFPHEREHMTAALKQLLAATVAARLDPGHDMVDEPDAAWRRLLRA